jgi:predicted nucleotidyltransferase
MVDDAAFVEMVGGSLAGLPGVAAVALGGSRATGSARADSDWDFAVYYRDTFDPSDLRQLGWPGEVSEIGGWGGGVFNGGAWLEVDGRRMDVHYRDLDVVEHQLARAEAGDFDIEPLLFHLAGIPTYLLVAELAINRVLIGDLPQPEFPIALSTAAAAEWRGRADMTLDYARSTHARDGRVTQTAGMIAVAATQAAHSILASRRQWVTNEKTLLTRAGLTELDPVVADLTPGSLVAGVDAARRILNSSYP